MTLGPTVKRFISILLTLSFIGMLAILFLTPRITSWTGYKIDFSFKAKETILYYLNPDEKSHQTTNPFSVETQEERKATLKQYCDQVKNMVEKKADYNEAFLMNKKHKVIYCRVPKVGCTTWRRVFLLLQGYQKKLYELPESVVHGYPVDQLRMLSKSEIGIKKNEYYSFMFSRHPHDRLFSAYRNKIMNPKNTTAYLEYYGPWMVYDHIKTSEEMDSFLKVKGIDKKKIKISFSQFVRFVLRTSGNLDDPHWKQQTEICKICNFNFNYLGKFETMHQDAELIFKDINRTDIYNMFGDETVYTKKTTTMLKKYYGQLSGELLQEIFDLYKHDFEAFGYDPYYYINF